MEPPARLRTIPAGSPRDERRKRRPARPHLHRRSRPAVARLQVDVRGRRHLYDAWQPTINSRISRRRRSRSGAGRSLAHSARTSFQVLGGQSTALRNVFGTEPGRPRPDAGNRASQLPGVRSPATQRRAAHTRTWDLDEFARTVDASRSGRARRPRHRQPDVAVRRRRIVRALSRDRAPRVVSDYSYLAGTHVLLPRGWVQVNASRFSPGDLPVLNASLQDRSGIFTAGGVRRALPPAPLRGLGNASTPTSTRTERRNSGRRTRSNADTAARVCRLAARSSFTLRVEDGGRLWHPAIAQHAADAGDTSGQRHRRRARRMAIVAPGAHRVRTLLPPRKRRYLVNGLELHAARFVWSVLPERLAPHAALRRRDGDESGARERRRQHVSPVHRRRPAADLRARLVAPPRGHRHPEPRSHHRSPDAARCAERRPQRPTDTADDDRLQHLSRSRARQASPRPRTAGSRDRPLRVVHTISTGLDARGQRASERTSVAWKWIRPRQRLRGLERQRPARCRRRRACRAFPFGSARAAT